MAKQMAASTMPAPIMGGVPKSDFKVNSLDGGGGACVMTVPTMDGGTMNVLPGVEGTGVAIICACDAR